MTLSYTKLLMEVSCVGWIELALCAWRLRVPQTFFLRRVFPLEVRDEKWTVSVGTGRFTPVLSSETLVSSARHPGASTFYQVPPPPSPRRSIHSDL